MRVVQTDAFDLATYRRLSPGHGVLTVYLEGDGNAWITATRLSDDPTPKDPVALRLAARDPSPSVAYVARPCQFVAGAQRRHCRPVYWANGRFAPEVVKATSDTLRALLREAGAQRLRLVGYSGGGTLALLMIEQGLPIDHVVTVAAPLDNAAWVRFHDISPLEGSLDPGRNPGPLAALPQTHFVGGDDRIVPPALSRAFYRRMGSPGGSRIVVVPGYTHQCCWAEDWPRLLRSVAPEPSR